MRVYDVLIGGGGNAAMTAAITAAEAGASVLVCEAAPVAMRGGNTRHTRNLRAAHDAPTSVMTDRYPVEEYLEDLMQVTKGETDRDLAEMTIRESANLVDWMEARGVRFQPALSGTLNLGRTNAFFLGGGKALLNALYRHAEGLGVEIRYDTAITEVDAAEGAFTLAKLDQRGFPAEVRAKTFIAAAGGFQANIDWLASAWGPAARNFLIRGTPYNRGVLLGQLLEQEATSIGDPTQCHAVAIDGRAPKFDGGIATRLDCIPFSIVVNKEGERFYDEGEDFWPKRYAIWGRLVAGQPDQVAYSIIDAKSSELFMPSIFPPVQADSIGELATRLGLDAEKLISTVMTFNNACRPGDFDSSVLDGRATTGLTPAKTNWARPLDTPPYSAYPLRPGVTFTYLSVAVDATARVLWGANRRPAQNIWATGEMIAGNILGQGYMGGTGMTIGAVFGRIAGREAAAHALN